MKERTEKVIANKIMDLACNTAKNTVGKSVPLLAHEVKMPESVRQEFLNKEIDK
ncbi:hypothetical protein [Kineothrix sp. MB12-C1]|uniref:hypothetical protein n=1 Tax=Kineothrix sp. MB12-C1 TaxID=3070215 RepID=UPI0027D1F631|nr:hypothetical protein [Kineothrix sp. MB12-C1]WMC94381.1 hypothetical protein RBB56_09060 [Kineothrix sp. MB12-C1]